MITNEKFENSLNEIRSRLYSPVFNLPEDQNDFCLELKYNIRSSGQDGFKVVLENYENHNEQQTLLTKLGQATLDKWHVTQFQVPNIYSLNRVRK